MDIGSRFEALIGTVLGSSRRLEAAEAHAIAALIYLAAEIDLDEDAEERRAIAPLISRVERLAGNKPRRPPLARIPLPFDDEARMAVLRELVRPLARQPVRELAYVLAYLATIADLELAPVERAFVDELRELLEIAPERAAELVATAAVIVTPEVSAGARA